MSNKNFRTPFQQRGRELRTRDGHGVGQTTYLGGRCVSVRRLSVGVKGVSSVFLVLHFLLVPFPHSGQVVVIWRISRLSFLCSPLVLVETRFLRTKKITGERIRSRHNQFGVPHWVLT